MKQDSSPQWKPGSRTFLRTQVGIAAFATSLFLLPAVFAQSPVSLAMTRSSSLPDAPEVASDPTRHLDEYQVASYRLPETGEWLGSTPQTDAPPAQAPPTTPTPAQTPTASAEDTRKQSEEQLKQEEHQRILGVMPAFNSVNGGDAPPLTAGQKFQLMFKSTTDPYIFGFAAFTAGIGQAQNSHAAYGQGSIGYLKRFGANYADTADGNLWGNAILPILLHQDPRYFRLGKGTFRHRLLYSMSTTVICRSDAGKLEPNYSNVLGNLISGGISNIYYPEADRGAAQTFQSAATVTAEGMIGAALIEFWPDIQNHYHLKRQAKRDAAAAEARSGQRANPTGMPPQ